MTLKLGADVAIVADSINGVNGLAIQSLDGRPRTLRLLVPGSEATGSSTHGISLSANAVIDSNISAEISAPGNVTINGTSSLTGRVASGCFSSSGTVNLTYAPVTSQ